ncbi:bifunctional diguanylate cyclase/phosphodiesterase [Pilimelia terevasa]|uniref:Bifunctional diguanylate cyclase/phosphodiesterase n=1 Tax=Pilimelia terevasa TaxID=53372 RepID=A0A8J3FHA5_9ACTN|nr:bifunctional diguanylate cyclase/phosphodiesterase [Pilimelia terevasa]GGK13518.1 bifunctional diguanylate cyclase/phosphodiesterase [Pilimelia terevasa]
MSRPVVAESRPPQLIWLVTGTLAVIAAILTAVATGYDGVPALRHWQEAAALLVLFVAADAAYLRVDFRRQVFSINISELPLVLALAMLPPVPVIVIRLAAAALIYLFRGRLGATAIKQWFNFFTKAACTSAAAVIVAAYQPLKVAEVRSWLVLVGAVLVHIVLMIASNSAVLAIAHGRRARRDITAMAVPALAVGAVNTTLGLVVLLVLEQSAWATILLVVLVVSFVLAYRSYSRFMRQHHRLQELYDLTAHVRETRLEATLYDRLLHGTRQMLRAQYATLWLPADRRHPEVLLTSKIDVPGLIDLPGTPDALRRYAVGRGSTVAVGANFEAPADLGLRVSTDAILVPLRSGPVVIGCIEVAGRIGEVNSFHPEDVRLLETLAAHVGVAVENSRLVDRLRFDAYHDALTGLPNRRRILQALEESVKFRAPGEVVAVLLFDVDGLRDVNDSLGHAAGDKLLVEVSRRLRELAPPAALVGRLGSDEFVVTLRVENVEAAAALAGELRGQLRVPMDFGALTLDVDTAVGVVVHPDHGSDPATLIQRADVAARAAELIPAGVQTFNPALESRSARRLGLANDLRRAIDQDELEIYFQPQVSLRDRHLVGVECLARWEHPTHGSVDPEDFVAVAEHTGQLSRLTEAVLKEGLRRCRQWADAGRPLQVAVNLSSRTLVDATFPDRVEALIREFGVDPARVTFEVAEDSGAPDRPMPMLQRLHEIGVQLSVDDFGTGYSSLSYLRRLPVQEVKIDRNFVQGMATDPGDLAIVRAVVDLARHFGLTVVAEGVESELTLDLLREIGCDVGQGFLFSRPLPYERLEAWLGQQTEPERTPAGEVRRLRAVP